MKRLRWMLAPVLLATLVALAQQRPFPRKEEDPVRLPDGRSQAEEMLKADHKASLKDAAELMRLSEELKIDLEKNDRHVLSISSLKKTEEIEKIAKRIRSRMKRY